MQNQKDSMTLKWIGNVSGSALWWTVLLTVVRVCQGCFAVVYAYAMGRVVDCAAAGISDAFYRQLVLFIMLVLVTLLLQAVGRYASEKSRAALDAAFRLHVFSQLLYRNYAKVTRVHTGEWLNRITSDTNVVVNAVASIVPELVGAFVRILGAMLSLLHIAPWVVYILLPCGLLMMVFSYFLRKCLKRYHKDMQESDGTVRSFMQERLTSLLVIRTFTQEDATKQMAEERMDDFVYARMRRSRFVNLCNTVVSTAVNGAQVLGIGVCGWGILNGVMSYGTMSSVLYLINMLETPFDRISGYLAQFYSMLASAERLLEIEEYEQDAICNLKSEDTVQTYYAKQLHTFGLRNVTFSYEEEAEKRVLEDFSMEICKGEFVALIGESGCGKSTALKLLLNLYPLNEGKAYLRDRDGKEQSLDASWRGMFAYVPQGNQLIAGTIRETVTFSNPALMAQEDEIYKALQIACADVFVRQLPDGLDTRLGERGSGLSEGQMQRLSVARAILSGRPILLLDEATSALDAATEEQLLKNLRAMTERTVLIITHREAVLEYCDKRISFENSGRAVAEN